jgi:molecular chaperone GrpE
VGEVFNPRLHDAVLTVPGGDAAPGTVVAELASGYQVHDRVIRPAQVSVAEAVEVTPASGAAAPPKEGSAPEAEDDAAERSRN